MLQTIHSWLGHTKPPLLPPSKAVPIVNMTPPTLRVSVHISHPTLSLSMPQTPPVIITLKVQVEGMEPITVDTHGSILDSRTQVMFAEGFSFRDHEDGQFLERLWVNFCSLGCASHPGIREIPPVVSTSPPYEIQHKLCLPQFMDSWEMGFKAGHSYDVGFTSVGGCVSWWRMGKKDARYPSGRRMPRYHDLQGSEEMQFQPTNVVSFEVVD